MNVQDAPHRRLGGPPRTHTQEVQRGWRRVTLNAGGLGAISRGQRELERKLRAAKYGTEGSEAYCARGRPFVSQRAPPRAPALAAHDQRLLQEDQSRSAEN